jgi:2-dehydro-3-deoxyphosphogluconate aldolase/(4S)-4-hydroxy-2-oxoglutarate aldolase
MDRGEVLSRIQEIGILPAVRVCSSKDARFAAEAINRSGISIAEITMTVPGAIEVISHLARSSPDMVVGAGTVLDTDTAQRCLDAGARFLTSPGLVMDVLEFAVKRGVAVLPGALTPTEVIAAWRAGGDFVKIFPSAQMGGPGYIKAMKVPLPQIPLIATGGVNQETAGNFILAGASALGIGGELMPPEAIRLGREDWIHELARRYLGMVKAARAQRARGERISSDWISK